MMRECYLIAENIMQVLFPPKNKVVLARANQILAVTVCTNHFTGKASGSSTTNAGITEACKGSFCRKLSNSQRH